MISIVITYYNRREQFLRTLKSIQYFGNPQIIVVDDASDEDQRLEDVEGITLIRIPKEDKKWTNTCIPNNIGISRATGDIIIVQNAECAHTGDILSYCTKLNRGTMFSFAAYSLDRDLPSGKDEIPVLGLKPMIMKEPQRIQVAHHGWYNHSKYRPCALHFCNAMLRVDMEMIGGFDERYAPGLAYEDDEFVLRIKRSGMDIKIIDDPFVIHQKHKRTDYGDGARPVYLRNKNLFETVTSVETSVRPPQNTYYTKSDNPATTTHVPLTRAILAVFNPRSIVELGIGWYSTPLFSQHVKSGATYLGVENDEGWINDMKRKCPGLNFVHHELSVSISVMMRDLTPYQRDLIIDYYKSITLGDGPRLLFVDNYGSCRVLAINTLREKFNFIMLHDCEIDGAMMYGYDKINTEGFNVLYLKNNLSWTMVMIREGKDFTPLFTAVTPFIEEHVKANPDIKWMKLTPKYF